MKMNLAFILIFIQLSQGFAELIFMHLTEKQSLQLSCSPQQDLGRPTGLHLYHRSSQGQITLLSVTESSELKVNPEHRGRLELQGRLDSLQVNVTISHLHHSDTGLYMWELSYRKYGSSLIPSTEKVFLLVDGAGGMCQCSSKYLPLLWTILATAGLVVLTLIWLATDICMKKRHHHQHTTKPTAPIYEEMTRKQLSAGTSQNNHEAPPHLEEDDFPVYANPNILEPQDNYYACPRQLALRA